MNAIAFFRTPKGIAILILPVLALVGSLGAGTTEVLPVLGTAVATAMIVDIPLLRIQYGKWKIPDGALLTGMFIGMILSPNEPLIVAATTSLIAIMSKYIARVRHANVFNPATLALVASYFLFHTEQNWWGAMPEVTPFPVILLLPTGIFIARRLNKMPAAICFLGVFYLLFTIASFVGAPAKVEGLYRAPDIQAALFFALYMVSDPPTSPPKSRDQIVFGIITAVVAFAVFELNRGVYFMLAGVLVANVWEAQRRWRAKRVIEARRALAGSALLVNREVAAKANILR